jgi:hypothetical protein
MLGSALLRVRRHEGTVIVAKDEETAMRFFQTSPSTSINRYSRSYCRSGTAAVLTPGAMNTYTVGTRGCMSVPSA